MPRIGLPSKATEEPKDCIFCGEEVDKTDLLSGWATLTQVVFAGTVGIGNVIQKAPGIKLIYHQVCHVPRRRSEPVAAIYCRLCGLPEAMHDKDKACPLQSPTGQWGSHPLHRFMPRH